MRNEVCIISPPSSYDGRNPCSWAQQCMPVNLALKRLRQKNHEFPDSLGHIHGKTLSRKSLNGTAQLSQQDSGSTAEEGMERVEAGGWAAKRHLGVMQLLHSRNHNS